MRLERREQAVDCEWTHRDCRAVDRGVGSELRQLGPYLKGQKRLPREPLWFSLASGYSVVVVCRRAAEELYHCFIEGRNIVGLAAGDKILVVHDLTIDPLRSCVAKVGLKRWPGGHCLSADGVGLDERPGGMTDGGDRLTVVEETLYKGYGLRIGSEVVRVHDAAGQMQRVVFAAVCRRQLDINLDLVAPVGHVPGFDLAGLDARPGSDDVDLCAGILKGFFGLR